MTETRKARVAAAMNAPGKHPVDSSLFADGDGEIECTSLACAYNKSGYCRYHAVADEYPAYTEEDGCLSGVPEDPVVAMPATLSPSSARIIRLKDDQGDLDTIRVDNWDEAFEPAVRKAYDECEIADGNIHDEIYAALRAKGYSIGVVRITSIRL